MKRHWRPGRIILAVLLIGIAALAVYVWPKRPRWQHRFDMTKELNYILSVDETKRLFYTRYMDFSSMENPVTVPASPLQLVFELRCYDLNTGNQVWNQPDPPASAPPSDRLISICNVVLSPDHRQCAYINNLRAEVDLYDLPPRTKRASIHLTGFSPGEHLSVSYSPQGDWLLARTDKQVFVYDASTAKLIHQLDIPKEHIIGGGRGDWNLEQDGLLCSTDKRYLVMTTNFVDNILVFDLPGKKMIGECKGMYLPRLLNDGKTLLCLPEHFVNEDCARWYRLHESALIGLPGSVSEMAGEAYLCSNSTHFATAKMIVPASPPFWYDWSWLSDTVKYTMAQWLGLLKLEIEVSLWSNNTGMLEKRFPIVISMAEGLPSSVPRSLLLNDSSQILLNIGTAIALWDLPPRRPLSCWLSASSISAFALWLAWPRRMKATPLAASPHAGK